MSRNQPIDYTTKYQIRSGRTIFADYVQRRQLIQEGRLIGLNIYSPDLDASIIPVIKEASANTTPGELSNYLVQVASTADATTNSLSVDFSSPAPASAPAPAPAPAPVTTVPDAPTGLSATAGNNQVIISFTAGSDGGSAITNYKYSTDNGSTYTAFSPADTSSPVTITGLTNGTTYQIKLLAVNAIGDGAESDAVSVTPSFADQIVASLTTSLATYNAAATDDWVKITSTEWSALQSNITGTNRAGATDSVMSASGSGGLANAKAALVANSVTVVSPAILANQYLYGFSMRWSFAEGVDMRVYTNTNSASTGGFNQVGSVLPDPGVTGLVYYVRKGVSTTNGATAGALSFFTGTKMDYPNANFTGSAGYIAFNISATPKPTMRWLLTDGTVPPSNSTLSGSQANYGMFMIQGLTTGTIQWA